MDADPSWMTRVAILGSCVTRDLFELPTDLEVALYTSRTSLISLMAAPVALPAAGIPLDSSFQRRCVERDFAKSFFDDLVEAEADALVIDLIDERFHLVAVDGSYVTQSRELASAGLEGDPRFAALLLRKEPVVDELFARAAEAFVARLADVFPLDRVVLHRAPWMATYRDPAGAIAPFPQERLGFIAREDARVTAYADVLAGALGGPRVIDLHDAGFHADAGHRWGLEPFHHERAYNEAALAALDSFLVRPGISSA